MAKAGWSRPGSASAGAIMVGSCRLKSILEIPPILRVNHPETHRRGHLTSRSLHTSYAALSVPDASHHELTTEPAGSSEGHGVARDRGDYNGHTDREVLLNIGFHERRLPL